MNLCSRIGCEGTIETVLNSMIDSLGIKILKGFKKRGVFRGIIGWTLDAIFVTEVSARSEEFRAEITNVSHDDYDGVGEVSGAGGKECDGGLDLCFGNVNAVLTVNSFGVSTGMENVT